MMMFTSQTAKKEFIRITDKLFSQKYEMLTQLGKGSFGQVHKAKSKHGNFVAIKKFKSEALSRFYAIIREISNLKKMDHPNILKLYDCYIVDERRYYMVTEYCKNGSLADHLLNELNEKEKINICQQIAQGLAHAHQLGIVHRDLKPDNIFIANKNIVKIGDFGQSTRIQNNEVLTSRVGSPAYMDDRVDKNLNYDHTADIYSLGMLYVCIFQGKGIYDQCRNNTDIKRYKSEIYRDYDTNIQKHIQNLPSPIKEVVKNCLNPNYSIRYSAEEIASIIKKKLEEQKGISKNLISTTEDNDESCQSQINSFACNLIAMNKQFQFRHRCQKTRQELFNLLIKNKQNLQKIVNIQSLKYLGPDTKAQFTFTVFLFYQYWLQQVRLIINGNHTELGSKYNLIDSKTIDQGVLELAEKHIKAEKQKIENAMFGCARRIQGTLHLIGQEKYLPDNFKEFISLACQREPLNFNKTSHKALLSNIGIFFQKRVKKQYDFNRGQDEHDPKLQTIREMIDSFV